MTSVHVLAVGITNTLALWVAFDFLAGLAVGIAFALVGGLGSRLEVPLPRRTASLREGLPPETAGPETANAAKTPIRSTIHIPFGFSEVGTAWTAFLPAKTILATRRRLRIRLMRFLDDCYRLGLLTVSRKEPSTSSGTPNFKSGWRTSMNGARQGLRRVVDDRPATG